MFLSPRTSVELQAADRLFDKLTNAVDVELAFQSRLRFILPFPLKMKEIASSQ